MHTIVLQNTIRKTSDGASYSIQVVGDSPVKDAVKESIRALEYHPAKAERRSLIDMLGIIEQHNFQIRHAEHFTTDDDLQGWLFVLQG